MPPQPQTSSGTCIYHVMLRERTESISISLKRLTVSCAAYYNTRRTGISYGVIQRINGKMKLGQLKV